MTEIIKVIDLTMGYKNEVIKNITFSGNKGEVIGILGLNGSGKTTLLKGICGVGKIIKGEVLINNISLNSITTFEKAKLVSMMSQKNEVISGLSVKQIISMGCYSHKKVFGININDYNEIAVKMAKLFNIENLLEKECSKLSQGQKQLVFLAKLMAQNTPVILLDEPDSSLDYVNKYAFFRTIKENAKEKATIIVLHDPSYALNWCDKVIIIKDGVIDCEFKVKDKEIKEIESYLRKIYPQINLQFFNGTEEFGCFFKA